LQNQDALVRATFVPERRFSPVLQNIVEYRYVIHAPPVFFPFPDPLCRPKILCLPRSLPGTKAEKEKNRVPGKRKKLKFK
jgi:hypothetical protein